MSTCDEPLLEGEAPLWRIEPRAQRVVGHRKDRRLDTDSRGEPRRHTREWLSRTQRIRPDQMQADVAVAELEPRLAAVCGRRLERVPRLVRAPPATLVVRQPGECVEHAVEVGRDRETEDLEIVADVDDRGHVCGVEHVDETAQETRATDAACENGDLHARASLLR